VKALKWLAEIAQRVRQRFWHWERYAPLLPVPKTLSEAVVQLYEIASKDQIIAVMQFKDPGLYTGAAHHGFGRELRNAWQLWDNKSSLRLWFLVHLGLKHADDISSVILRCFWCTLHGEPWLVAEQVEVYYRHWRRHASPKELSKCIDPMVAVQAIDEYYFDEPLRALMKKIEPHEKQLLRLFQPAAARKVQS
jgi:hypothetical protein